jgi:RNA polymerase sigma-70 factor (ECF subfamily)
VKDFEEVALPHLESVARFACSLTRSEADADDLVQETFLRAFRGWHTFAAGTDCRRWLFTICRNIFVKSGMRGRLRVVPIDVAPDPMPTDFGGIHTDTRLLERIQLAPAIEAAVEALHEPYHTVLVMVDVEGMTYEDVADVLGIPIGTVRSRLSRARGLLRNALVSHAQDLGIATSGSGAGLRPLITHPLARRAG